MKALLINGSPNEQGCTARALREIEGVLAAHSVDSERLWIGKGSIHGCTGCGACRKRGACVSDGDAVNETLPKLAACDLLVLASPVYYASPNGALLAFLDRLFFASGDLSGKVGASIVSARRAGTTATIDVLNKYLLISGITVASSQYWPMVHGQTPAEVEQDVEGLQTLRLLGENLVWLGRSIEAGRMAGVLPPVRETPRARTNFIR